jgi:hypothetical protein
MQKTLQTEILLHTRSWEPTYIVVNFNIKLFQYTLSFWTNQDSFIRCVVSTSKMNRQQAVWLSSYESYFLNKIFNPLSSSIQCDSGQNEQWPAKLLLVKSCSELFHEKKIWDCTNRDKSQQDLFTIPLVASGGRQCGLEKTNYTRFSPYQSCQTWLITRE